MFIDIACSQKKKYNQNAYGDFFASNSSLKKKERPKGHSGRTMSAPEKAVLKALSQFPSSLEYLILKTGLKPGELHSALIALQLDKLIIEVGKGQNPLPIGRMEGIYCRLKELLMLGVIL